MRRWMKATQGFLDEVWVLREIPEASVWFQRYYKMFLELLEDFFEGMTVEGSYSVLEEQPRWMVHELICVVYKTFQEFLKEFQAVLMFSRIFRKVLVRLAETFLWGFLDFLRDLRSDNSRVLEGVPGILRCPEEVWELFCRLSGIKETCWGSWEDCFSCRMEVSQDALNQVLVLVWVKPPHDKMTSSEGECGTGHQEVNWDSDVLKTNFKISSLI